MRTGSLRTAAACAVLAAGLAGPASAARAVCRVAPEVPGDAQFYDLLMTAVDDLLAGDVASDDKYVTVAIRSADVDTSSRGWYFETTVKETRLTFMAVRGPDGDRFSVFRREPNAALDAIGEDGTLQLVPGARGVVDEKRNEVRITISVADLASALPLRRGDRMSAFYLESTRFTGPSAYHEALATGWTGVGMRTDWADGGNDVAGTKSCLKPGS